MRMMQMNRRRFLVMLPLSVPVSRIINQPIAKEQVIADAWQPWTDFAGPHNPITDIKRFREAIGICTKVIERHDDGTCLIDVDLF